jgi:hypothetical protein
VFRLWLQKEGNDAPCISVRDANRVFETKKHFENASDRVVGPTFARSRNAPGFAVFFPPVVVGFAASFPPVIALIT